MKHKNLKFIRRPARRNIKKIMKALREHGCVGIYRQMHFGVAFYVVPTDGVCRTPCHPKPDLGEIMPTIYEEWYDMVPDESRAIEIYRGGYGMFPWHTVLRRLKERRLAS